MGKQFFEVTSRYNGRTRYGISSIRLRSGITGGSVTEALHQSGILSGNLTAVHVFITAFLVQI